VDLSMAEGKLMLNVQGVDKLWAFTEQPRNTARPHHRRPSRYSEVARGWWHGVRMPGTSVPGVITAGTFYQDGKRVFWDVHHPEKTIVIDLHDERFNETLFETLDNQQNFPLTRPAAPSGLREIVSDIEHRLSSFV